MFIRFGNLTVTHFAQRVGAEFTPEEIETLESYRTEEAEFSDPNKFHIFEDPAVCVVIGPVALEATKSIWVGADARKQFNRPVGFYSSEEV